MAENDFHRASMRGLGKKILLGDEPLESVEPIESADPAAVEHTAAPEFTANDPAILQLTADEEFDLLGTVATPLSAAPVHATLKQQAIPPLELDMPPVANLVGETLPLTEDLQTLVTEAFETADPLSFKGHEAMPPFEDDPSSFVILDPADVVLSPEVAVLVDENFETWNESIPPVAETFDTTLTGEEPVVSQKSNPQPEPAPSTPVPAERNELGHMLPLIAGWVVAILVLIYQLLKDSDKDEKDEA